jgi:hypothetical protein
MPYWISFRIHQDASYQKVYDALRLELCTIAQDRWWFETTSFFIIESESVARVIATVKSCLREQSDLAIIGSFYTKTLTVIGKCDDKDIFELVEFAKKG